MLDSDDSSHSDEIYLPAGTYARSPLAEAVRNRDVRMMELLSYHGVDPADSHALADTVATNTGATLGILPDAFRHRHPRGRADFSLEVMQNAVRCGDLTLVETPLAKNVRFSTLASLQDLHENIRPRLRRSTPLNETMKRVTLSFGRC